MSSIKLSKGHSMPLKLPAISNQIPFIEKFQHLTKPTNYEDMTEADIEK